MRVVLFGLVLVVALVGWHQWQGRGPAAAELPGVIVDERAVTLAYTRHEGTVVGDANGGLVAEFGSGEGGILEMLAIAIDRERTRIGADTGAPFLVRLREGASLSIFDPETGRDMSLGSYGSDNVAFLRQVVFQ